MEWWGQEGKGAGGQEVGAVGSRDGGQGIGWWGKGLGK